MVDSDIARRKLKEGRIWIWSTTPLHIFRNSDTLNFHPAGSQNHRKLEMGNTLERASAY